MTTTGGNNTTAKSPRRLLETLREEMPTRLKGGIYHRTQVDLTYNSNHMEGSRLTLEQTRLIFETNTIGHAESTINVDDLIETVNHFAAVDHVIAHAREPLSQELIKALHAMLKRSTSDSRREWFAVGDYKRLPNEVGGHDTCPPEHVEERMSELIDRYNAVERKSLEHILDFHVALERIHPFQDGNGRVGRLIMFKECLANDIVPFIITDCYKAFYYRGLEQWGRVDGYLTDTCLSAQDDYRALMAKFRVEE